MPAGHSGVGDETSIRFMVGEDISTDARGKVNSEMTCKQERVLGSADGTPLTQLVSQEGIIGSSIESGWSGCIGPCTK